jgi:hypothetical protein
VQIAGQPEVWTGIADDQGRAMVMTPYPLVDRLRLGSPPGSGQGSITGQSWNLTVQVLYTPSKFAFPLANQSGVVWPFTVTPNLKGILEDQKPATIWTNSMTPGAKLTATLNLGQNLVLRSTQASPPVSSALNITQGTSPP